MNKDMKKAPSKELFFMHNILNEELGGLEDCMKRTKEIRKTRETIPLHLSGLNKGLLTCIKPGFTNSDGYVYLTGAEIVRLIDAMDRFLKDINSEIRVRGLSGRSCYGD
jgi:hypothetical protein